MDLIILGAGEYGREIADIVAQKKEFEHINFLDDIVKSADVVGKCEDFHGYINENTLFYPAFGDNNVRAKWLDTLLANKAKLATIIHSTAYVSPTVSLGVAVAILPQALVNSYSLIEDGCMINSGAIIDHNCVIGRCSHVCVGAIIKADNNLPASIKIEAGTLIERGIYKGNKA